MMRLVEAKDGADYSARAMTQAVTRTVILGLLAGAAFAVPAAAQTQMYPGQGITVNPAAINGHGYISPYGRSPYPDIIHLHMPVTVVHHHHVAAKPKPADVATTAPAETAPPPAPAAAPAASSPFPAPLDSLTDTSTPPPAKHKHHAPVTQVAAPPPAAEDNTGQDAALPLTLDPQAEHPVVQPPKHKRAQAGNTVKTASIDTDTNAQSGLNMRSQILFPRGDPDISSANVDKMRSVAADLTSLLGAGASRVELDAYGGAPGDKGSDARRLSLKRALGVRELLIEDGVPAEKIDVRAMGGIDDSGAPDRVDVLVRGG
jgi:outer membrane protein OmpA-like peptidoglycan-associated protein